MPALVDIHIYDVVCISWVEKSNILYKKRRQKLTPLLMLKIVIPNLNTPGTAGGPGGRNRTLASKSRKNARKSVFFRKK